MSAATDEAQGRAGAARRHNAAGAAPRGRPWRDPAGRLSGFKALVFAGLFVPAAILLWRLWADDLGPRPLVELNHVTGRWAIYFLLITLAITPAKRLLRWGQIAWVRRMLGLAAAAYAAAHVLLYVIDQGWDIPLVAGEIVSRVYLTIGFVALLIFVPLAATSTNRMMRRMGRVRWARLQMLVYPLAILGLVHFFMQTKADLRLPLIAAGMLAWLLIWRIADRWPVLAERWPVWATAVLSVLVAAGVALSEALYYWMLRGIDMLRVLETNLSLTPAPRPAAIVLAAGLAFAAASAARKAIKARQGR